MGFWGRLFGGNDPFPFNTYDAAQRVLPDPYEPFMGNGGIPVADPGVSLFEYQKLAVDTIWRTQPNIRKVVDFIARNVASIPLHTYERVSDTNRQRVHDGALAGVISTPHKRISPFRFWHSVISDGLLYDRWAVMQVPEVDGSTSLVQIPSWRLRLQVDALRQVVAAWYWVGDEANRLATDVDGWRKLDLDTLIFDHGYAPREAGLSPLETLADILAETAEAVTYRRQLWANGARVPAWIERPAGADWSPEARQRFSASFRAAYTNNGENAGGVPLLEDGMKLNAFEAFTPQDAMDIEGRRLSAVEVAGAYHIAPELVGAREGTYSNVDAFRQMLYRDSLGPYITAWEGALNTQLTPLLGDGRSLYVEAHIETKLRGSFEEQAKVKQSATGAPWLTRNEARALENRPPVDGGDDLVVPLNVLIGGQASLNDSAPKSVSKSATSGAKARASEPQQAQIERVVKSFFRRQGAAVLSALGSKADDDWWDGKRWDRELADDLYRLAASTTESIGKEAAQRLGFTADDYDTERTLAFLKAVAESRAGMINSTTRDRVKAALDGDGTGMTPASVFEDATGSRGQEVALTLATTFGSFATTESAKQVAGDRATKTWVTTSKNPRSSHSAMSGETVGVDEPFSNGMDWPGDPAGGADEVAGCQCDVEISIP